MRTRVKICGITDMEDAQSALDFGAHALGFDLATLSPEAVKAMVKVLAPFAVLVGVCPRRPAMELRELLRQCGLDIAQLPAESTVEDCRLLRQRFRLLKRVVLPADATAETVRKQLAALAAVVDGVLVELPPAGVLAALRDAAAAGPPVVVGLSQGLEPLAELLQRFRPYAVDAGPALDMADQPGRKDPRLVRRLLRTIRWETRRPVGP